MTYRNFSILNSNPFYIPRVIQCYLVNKPLRRLISNAHVDSYLKKQIFYVLDFRLYAYINNVAIFHISWFYIKYASNRNFNANCKYP